MADVYPFSSPSSKVFYQFGDEIGIYPTPNQVKTFRVHYVKKPTTLDAATETPEIPEQYHMALASYALMQLSKRLLPQAYPIFKQEWDEEKDVAISHGAKKVREDVVYVKYQDI